MRRYETIYIVRPNLSEDDINAVVDQTNGVIENLGGQIIQLDRWGLKKLAYLIKKEARGFYVYCEYAGTPEAVDELERLFRIDNNVLKYMTVKLQDIYVADEVIEEVMEEASTEEEVVAPVETETVAAEEVSSDTAE